MRYLIYSICFFSPFFLTNLANASITTAKKNDNLQFFYEASKNSIIIDFDELKKKIDLLLPKGSCVGFDLDDTLVFSSNAFIAGLKKFHIKEKSLIQDPDFWYEISTSLDARLTKAKEIAKKIIKFHSQRGDELIIVTSRIVDQREAIVKSSIAKLLNSLFSDDLKKNFDERRIFLTGLFEKDVKNSRFIDKAEVLIKEKIQLFYGDSDYDIKSAFKARAQPVRIMRDQASSNTASYSPGRNFNNDRLNISEWILYQSNL